MRTETGTSAHQKMTTRTIDGTSSILGADNNEMELKPMELKTGNKASRPGDTADGNNIQQDGDRERAQNPKIKSWKGKSFVISQCSQEVQPTMEINYKPTP